MKLLAKYLSATIFISLLVTSILHSSYCSEVDYYSKGMELVKSGDWEKALKVWWNGYCELEKQKKIDPRIVIIFIEVVTEKKAKIL